MKIELFDHVENTDRPLSTIYEERLRFAAAVDGAGFYCLHVAEHHTGLHPRPGARWNEAALYQHSFP